jgi:hypothetical protein
VSPLASRKPRSSAERKATLFAGRALANRLRPAPLGRALVMALVAAAIVGPWIVRNCRVHGRFVFAKSTFGYAFWPGNNPTVTQGCAFSGFATSSSGPAVRSCGLPTVHGDSLAITAMRRGRSAASPSLQRSQTRNGNK